MRGPERRGPTVRRAFLALGALLVAAAGIELAVRAAAEVDADGNVVVLGRRLRPYRPPAARVARLAERFDEDAFLVYDPDTGWSPRPGATSSNGLYHYDDSGLRVPPVPRAVPEGALRVGLFGDSFIHGDDVAYADSLAGALAAAGERGGHPIEVLNFGVPGYGMDQALLRYRKLGRTAELAVVVLGFQSENVNRNVNLVRSLMWWKTGLPFSKPRFVPDEDRLRLVNHPPVPPDRLPDTLRDLRAWEALPYEYFYDPEDYRPRPWEASRAASLLFTALAPRHKPSIVAANGEPARVTLAIVAHFAREAQEDGARFAVLHVPKHDDLAALEAGGRLEYEDLAEAVRAGVEWIDPAPRMLAAAGDASLDDLFVGRSSGGHYAAAGNAAAAEALAEALLATAR